MAASAKQPSGQQAIIKAAQVVMHESANLIEEAKRALENPTNKDNQQRMAKVRMVVTLTAHAILSNGDTGLFNRQNGYQPLNLLMLDNTV